MFDRIGLLIKSTLSKVIARLRKINRVAVTLISVAVTALVLGYLVYRQREIILTYHWQFRPIPLLLSFVIFSVALFWVSVIWGWIINHFSKKLVFHKHIRFYIISNLAKRIPGTVWYLASRFQLYNTEGLDLKITAIASGLEMVLITLAGILVTLLFASQTLLEYHISPFIFIIIFIVGLVIIHPKVIQWALRLKSVEIQSFNYQFVIKGIAAYVISWILGGAVLFETGNLIYPIGIENLPYFITSWSLVGILSTILFFSPSNLGITEIGISLLLSKVVPSSIAVLIAISTRILMILFEILWAGVFLWIKLPDVPRLTQKD
jgi:hypothetical protein